MPNVKELVLQIRGGFGDNAGRNFRCHCATLDLSEICALFCAARERIEKNGDCGSAAQFESLVGVAESEIDLLRPCLVTCDVCGNNAVVFVSDVL